MPGYRYARPVGIVLTLLCVAFFVHSLAVLDAERLAALPLDGLVVSIVVWTLGYTFLLAGVALGFVHLAHATGHRTATPAEGLVIWGKANMAKYLPGNVLHFAGRQIIGARHGWPQWSIAKASLLEIALQLVLPCGLAMLLLIVFGRLAMLEETSNWLLLSLLAAAALATLGLAAWRLRHLLPERFLRPLTPLLDLRHPAALVPATIWYVVFFAGMSIIVWSLYTLVVGYIEPRHLPILAAAFLISWVMGFAIPGAPGGIGVREGSFAALGSVFLTFDALVIVAALMRLVTLLGEGLIFLIALLAGRGMAATTPAPPPPEAARARRRS